MPGPRVPRLLFDDESLASRNLEDPFGFVAEEVVDRVARARTDEETVVVDEQDGSAMQSRIEELNRVARRLIEVDVHVDEAKAPVADLVEARRNPSLVDAQVLAVAHAATELLL